jgi:hypothetical protein
MWYAGPTFWAQPPARLHCTRRSHCRHRTMPTCRWLPTPAGEKLSKQTLARAIDPASPVQTLHDALVFLGQAPPRALRDADLQTLWAWSLANWSLARVPAVISRPVPTDVLHNALGSPPPTAP